MAFFWFNPFSGEKLSSQFVHYLQASNYVSDITSAITTSAAVGAVGQRRAIEHASSQVVGSLRHGFDRMAKLNAELKSALDWRLSVVADQQRVGNLLTRNVALLLRIPDSEKERENLVREGFRFYQNASIDTDLYTDALDYLLRAEALKKQDYFVLHRIGMIYLHAPDAKVRDFTKAEDYFRRAAKYALVENDPRAEPLVKLLSGSVDAPLDPQAVSGPSVRSLAAESLLRGAVACHVQEKFTEAAELAHRAFTVAPHLLEAVYTRALALGRLGSGSEVTKLLSQVIDAEPVYAIRVALDFAADGDAVRLLEQRRMNAVARARHLWEGCMAAAVSGSAAHVRLESIRPLVEENTFMGAMDALKALTQPAQVGETPVLSLYQFVLDERERIKRDMCVKRAARARAKEDNDSAAVEAATATEQLDRLDGLIAARDVEDAKQRRKWFFPDDALLKRLEAEIATLTKGDIAAFKAECAELQERARTAQGNLIAMENTEELRVSDHADDVANKPAKEEQGHESELLAAILTRLGHPCSTHAVTSHPSFVRYTLRRLPDEKVEDGAPRVEALVANVAMALQAGEVRLSAEADLLLVERPTPPGARPDISALLASSSWEDNTAALPILLGVDEQGQPQVADLAVTGHAVIVGSDERSVGEVVRSMTASLMYRCGPESLRVVVAAGNADDIELVYTLAHALAPCATEHEVDTYTELFAYDMGEQCHPRLTPLTTFESVAEDEKLGATLAWVAEEIRLRREMFQDFGLDDFDAYSSRDESAYEGEMFYDDGTTSDSNLLFLNCTSFTNIRRERRGEVFGLPPRLCRLVVTVQESSGLALDFMCEAALTEILKNGPGAGIHCILGVSNPQSEALAYADKCGVRGRLSLKAATHDSVPGAVNLFSNGEMIWMSPDGSRARIHAPRFEITEYATLGSRQHRKGRLGKTAPQPATKGKPANPSEVRKQFVAAYGPWANFNETGMVAHHPERLLENLREFWPERFGNSSLPDAMNKLIASGHVVVVLGDGRVTLFSRRKQNTVPLSFVRMLEQQIELSRFTTLLYTDSYGGRAVPATRESLLGIG